jgi:hypothetical protein
MCPAACEDFLYVFKGARSAPCASWRGTPREVTRIRRARSRRPRPAGRARCARGTLTASRLAAPPLHLRHTAGCRPSVTPDTARCWLTAVTPASRARRRTPSSRRSSIEPRKITIKSALRASHAMAQAPLLTLIFHGSFGAYRKDG